MSVKKRENEAENSPELNEIDKIDLEVEEETLSFMKKTLIFSFLFIIVYTLWTQVALIIGIEPNDTVTEKVYEFFGLEVCALMFKKVSENTVEVWLKQHGMKSDTLENTVEDGYDYSEED